MMIREIVRTDAEEYLNLCKVIDAESEFLLFEAGERPTTLEQQKSRIETIEEKDMSTIFVVEENNSLIGYLIANGGQANRNRHSVYIVLGIKNECTGHGIGTRLFEVLEKWAKDRNIFRLELGLMEHNFSAFKLYKKMGFELEGVKRNAFLLKGNYVNEYMMSKMLGDN